MFIRHSGMGLALSLCLAALPVSSQDFPRTGNPLIENGKSAPFAGNWSVGFPDDDQTVVSTLVVTCEDPLIIETRDETHIALTRRDDTEPPVDIEVFEFSGRTTWFPPGNGLSSVAVWIDLESFYLYEVSATGQADWDWPSLHRRCPD